MAPSSTSPGAIAFSQATEAADALSPICTASSMVPSAQMQEAYRAHASRSAGHGGVDSRGS